MEVLCGGDPKKAAFHQTLLRSHFVTCMKQRVWTAFPKTCLSVPRCTQLVQRFQVLTCLYISGIVSAIEDNLYVLKVINL